MYPFMCFYGSYNYLFLVSINTEISFCVNIYHLLSMVVPVTSKKNQCISASREKKFVLSCFALKRLTTRFALACR